jgi:serine/threonine protein kinase/tetratricopeptide (TPR) repeat protein
MYATSTTQTRDAPAPVDDLERRVAFEAIRGRLFTTQAQPVAIGRFLVTSRVGQGGMGVVYSAYDPQLDRRVAVKVVRDLGRDEQEIERARRSLEREARAAAGLGHPNVVTIYDSGITGDSFYVAMEFVAGSTLRQWLRRQERTWTEIVRIFIAAGRGLQAAHAAMLVHCDFKPDNVLVGEDGRPRVADFGLVKHTSLRAEPPSLTDVHAPTLRSAEAGSTIGGTPSYMAPEQHDGVGIGPHSDQFAYCVALYEALFHAHPYPSREDPRRADVCDGELAKAHERGPVPRAIVREVLQGLRREPQARHPSMQVLVDRLERALRRRSLARWGLLGAAATSLAGVMGHAFASGEPIDPCADAAVAIEATWSEQTRTDVRSHLEGVAGPTEAEALTDRLTAHAEGWGRMRHESCEATHHRGEQSAELLELRTACLDRNLHAFSQVIAHMQGPSPVQAGMAQQLVEWLPPAESCAADVVRARMTVRSAHLGQTDRSRDAESERAYLEVAAQLDDARLELLVGRRADALALATAAEQAARAAGLRYLEAEATLVRTFLRIEAGELQGAEAELRRALALATEADDADIAAQVVVALLRLPRQGGPKVENRPLLVDLGRAWAARTRRTTVLRAQIDLEAATDIDADGKHDQALAIIDGALAAMAADGLQDHTVAGKLHMVRGQVLEAAGRLQDAEVELSALLARQRPRLPAGHVDLGNTTFLLGDVLRQLLRPARALPLMEEARSIYAARLGPYADRTLSAERNLGEIWQDLGEPTKAARAFEAALSGHQRAHGYFQPKQVTYLSELAELEHETGELVRARAHALAALTIAAKVFGREHPVTLAVGITLGKVALDRGELELARALLQTAYERLHGPKDDPAWAAEAAWHLARLAMRSSPPDRERALALTDEALEGFGRASGANARHFEEKIARWRETLAAH